MQDFQNKKIENYLKNKKKIKGLAEEIFCVSVQRRKGEFENIKFF